jgi:hypothetical protein
MSFDRRWRTDTRANFMAMPSMLKLITASVLGTLISVITTMLPNSSAGVFGLFDRHVTTSVWWESGAGTNVGILATLFCVSSILMIRRSRYGRPVYILALIAMSVSIPFVASVIGMNASEWRCWLIANVVWTVVLSLYLYLDTAVRNYFRSAVLR